MEPNFPPTERTAVRRLPARGAYDKAQIFAILDEAFLCHVGFCVEGQPYVIPTLFARQDEVLYLHGSAASRMLRTLSKGVPVCVTVTHVDGFVLARSAFHHSMNYRSAVVLGTATLVEDAAEKMEALRCFTDKTVPGRWDEVRSPNPQELKATTVLKLTIEEASAKVRKGPPKDDEEDYALPIWAGLVPLRTVVGEAIPDEELPEGAPQFDIERLAARVSRPDAPRVSGPDA